jgi:hypothetical protein
MRSQNFSDKIVSPKILIQTSSCLWGFHAFFNMKNTLSVLLSNDLKTKLYSQLKWTLKFEFWKDYHKTLAYMLENCKRMFESDKQSLMKEGPLERYMMKYLIYNDPDLIALREASSVPIEIHSIDFAFGFVQNDRNQVIRISQSIQRFRNSTTPRILVLFLGVVNHWTVLVCKSHPETTIYLDSQYADILNLDDINLSKDLDIQEEEFWKLTGKPKDPPFFHKYFKHCVYDTRMLLKNLEKIIIHGEEQFHTFCCRRVMHNVFKSFESTLAFIIEAESKALLKLNNMEKKDSSVNFKDSLWDEFRKRLYALEDGEYKEELKEFFFPISDAIFDYEGIMQLTKDDSQVMLVIENLQFWMFEYHPTHIYQCLFEPMLHYGSSWLTDQDMTNLTAWMNALQHILDLSAIDFSSIPEYKNYRSEEFTNMSKLLP